MSPQVRPDHQRSAKELWWLTAVCWMPFLMLVLTLNGSTNLPSLNIKFLWFLSVLSCHCTFCTILLQLLHNCDILFLNPSTVCW